MLLAVFVVQQGFLFRALFQCFLCDGNAAIGIHFAVEDHHLQGGKGIAGISIGKYRQGFQHFVFNMNDLSAEAALIL